MEIRKINIGDALLTAYLMEQSAVIKNSSCRPAVIVLPGGGYEFVSDGEREPIALAYAAKGFQAFTLTYSVGKSAVFPQPQVEVMKAVSEVRKRAKEFMVDPNKIALAGFSAGGHLAASVGVHFKNSELQKHAEADTESCRPNVLVLVYPCIVTGEYGYYGITSIHGNGLSEEEAKLLSVENYVDEYTPPAYVCHTADDTVVPSMNSLLFCTAMAKYKRPYELHVFARGPHGMSLASAATRPDPNSMDEAVKKIFADERTVAYLREVSAAFSVWFEESVAFLNTYMK